MVQPWQVSDALGCNVGKPSSALRYTLRLPQIRSGIIGKPRRRSGCGRGCLWICCHFGLFSNVRGLGLKTSGLRERFSQRLTFLVACDVGRSTCPVCLLLAQTVCLAFQSRIWTQHAVAPWCLSWDNIPLLREQISILGHHVVKNLDGSGKCGL